MSTPHNRAENGDFAKTVLMPGDPLRAKFIAETFLEDPRLVTDVRGMYGYTGTYQGRPISVMGSGMGMPSIGIYSYELYTQYGVENIIRIGSAGSYTDKAKLFDVVLAACEYTEERAKACDFSEPYYTDLPPVILVKAANADKYKTVDDINQASVIIGAQKNTTKAMAAADMFPEAANGMVLESLVPTLVTELKNGTIDLLVLDGNVGLSYVG